MWIHKAVHDAAAYYLNLKKPEDENERQQEKQGREILKCLLESEVFKFDEWKPYVSKVFDAGILSIQILLETKDETLSSLSIPIAPLAKLRKFAKDLIKMKAKNVNNTYSQPLSTNRLVSEFEFVPELTYLQYLNGTPITDKENELRNAINKAESIDYAADGLSKDEAVFLSLYSQESCSGYTSFYSVVNRALRERDNPTFVNLRPALYILDSCFHRLPSVATVAWRGMNVAPDLSKFQIGRTICFSGICSSSTEKNVALTFMEMTPHTGDHKSTLYKLNMKKTISIDKYSAFEGEKEVITGFCSKWKVLVVETNKKESFTFGSYQCDYFVELDQLDSEPLFRMNTKPTGLDLLSKIDYNLLTKEIEQDTAVFIVDFISQLDDRAKRILEEYLMEYWDELSLCFKDCILRNADACENLKNFLMGLTSLQEELQMNSLDPKHGLVLCDNHKIYDAYYLLHTETNHVRSIDGFVQMGFTNTEAEKLFYQDKHRQTLVHYYKMANLKGTLHSPQIFSSLIKSLRLKHYIKRDGLTIALYGLTRMTVRGVKYGLQISEKKFCALLTAQILGQRITYYAGSSDIIVATLVTAVQLGTYTLQLWYGDITLRQFLKSVCVSLVDVVAGCFGSSVGIIYGSVLASICGAPVLLGIGLGAIVGGVTAGVTAETLFRVLVENFFPDGELEEINAQRKLYLNALKVFNCLPDSSFDNIKRSYYLLAQANHPDKCENKESATEKFQSIVAAFEIVKGYHQVLNESCKLIKINVKDINVDSLNEWKKINNNNPELSKAFNIAYRHVAFTSEKWKSFRTWIDGDRQLTLEETVLAITTT